MSLFRDKEVNSGNKSYAGVSGAINVDVGAHRYPKKTMRKLEINLEEIAMAMEDGLREFNDYYLDTHTGRLILLPVEVVERRDWGDPPDEDDLDDWNRELLAIAEAIDAQDDEEGRRRYEWVPERESWEAYNSMVRFADSVDGVGLRRLLAVALDGRGAFRRFRNVLDDYPEERERWFRHKDAEARERATDWLRSIDIEPQERPRPEPTE